MTENNNNLNEEQLKEVAGGKELKPQIRDDAMYLLEKILIGEKLLFDPVLEEQFPDVKKLRRQVERAYITDSYSYRRQCVHLALWYTDKLIETPVIQLNKILFNVKEYLLQVQEIIGDRD